MGGKSFARGLDRIVAALAGRQHGVISRRQLLGIGMRPRAIERRIERGLLHPIHRGVYAVGHPQISREGHWMAALLACGDDAVLSHRSAAALWGIRQYSGRIETTVPSPRRSSRRFIARRSQLQPDEITEERGIPTTTVARTILDLGAVLDHQPLDKAIREADYLRLLDMSELAMLLERHPRRKGTAALRKATASAATAGMTITRSELEDRFRALLLKADLPTPVLNASIELGQTTTYEPDVLWRNERLIVELDSRQAHATSRAFEADRLRDRRLSARGYTVVRVTCAQLVHAPRAVIEDIGDALSACRRRRSGRPPAAARCA
jgi:predicted transcriptional regulator of viral defense system